MKRLALIFLYVCLSTLILFGSTTQASGTSGADSLTYFDAVRFPVIGKIYPDSLPFFSRIPYFLKPTTRESGMELRTECRRNCSTLPFRLARDRCEMGKYVQQFHETHGTGRYQGTRPLLLYRWQMAVYEQCATFG